MNTAAVIPTPEPLPALGGCELLTPAARSARCQELAERGFMVARVAEPRDDEEPAPSRPSYGSVLLPGALAEGIAAAVEISLALRGALPSGVKADASVRESARDQIFRVRALGLQGLCVVLPSIEALADEHATLLPPDSAALTAWRELSAREPVVLLLDTTDRQLQMLAPQPLAAGLDAAEPSEPGEPPEAEPPASWADDALAVQQELPLGEDGLDPPEPPDEPVAMGAGAVLRGDPLAGLEALDETERSGDAVPSSPQADEVRTVITAPTEEASRERLQLHTEALQQAQGPKPVALIETLFQEHYLPLLDAVTAGEADGEACEVVKMWRSAFQKSYAEGYAAMRVTGKRPTMVLDVPDIAARAAKLNGARNVQLLLVDSLRFALAEQLAARLELALSGSAVCVQRDLLWSALPSTTPTQLRLLARGARGLRDDHPQSERDAVVQRGRSVTTLRRVRIGQRDLLKLDVVEARLREAGAGQRVRHAALCDELCEVVAALARKLPQQTLLYLFGDHGYELPVDGPGRTAPARQGGASPEQVLVAGQGWLLGNVH